MDIGERIVKLRQKRNWNQRELARRAGLNYSVMNRIETGKRPLTDQEIKTFADLFGVSTDYLLGLTDDPTLKSDNDEEEFQKFIKDPELKRWYKELPKSNEEELRKLRKLWEIIKSEEE